MPRFAAVLAVVAGFFIPGSAPALGPQEVAVIFNKNLPASKEVADYYCQRRGVPTANLIELDVPDVTEIGRADYEKRIRDPLRAALKDRRASIRVLLTVYGVPLRVGDQEINDADKAAIEKIKPELQAAKADVQKLTRAVHFLKDDIEKEPGSPLASVLPDREKQLKAAEHKVTMLEERGALSYALGKHRRRRQRIDAPVVAAVSIDTLGRQSPVLADARGPTPLPSARHDDRAPRRPKSLHCQATCR